MGEEKGRGERGGERGRGDGEEDAMSAESSLSAFYLLCQSETFRLFTATEADSQNAIPRLNGRKVSQTNMSTFFKFLFTKYFLLTSFDHIKHTRRPLLTQRKDTNIPCAAVALCLTKIHCK
jgi:hypothetical protein